MGQWRQTWPEAIADVRGQGLLLALEFRDEATASRIAAACLAGGLIIRQTLGNIIRIFPALNIRRDEMEEGLLLFEKALRTALQEP